MMKKKYIAPSSSVYNVYTESPLLGESTKMEGSVIDGDNKPVEGTDWGYGGDGKGGDTPDAKTHSGWDMEW